MRLALALLATMLAGAAPAPTPPPAAQPAPPPAPVVAYDPATDFNNFRSYIWVFSSAPSNMDQNLYRQVRVAVDRALEAHGFTQSYPGDFAVAFSVGPRIKNHPTDYGNYAPYYSGEEASSHQKWINEALADRADHGNTLSIDIYDTYNRHAVWHGVAPVPIAAGTRQEIVEHEVADVLSMFPPKK